MLQVGVLLFPPGRDARPLQGYNQQYIASTHLYTWVKRDNVGKVSCLRKQQSNEETNLAMNHQPSK